MKGTMVTRPNPRTHGNAPKGRFKPGKEPVANRKPDSPAPKPAAAKLPLPLPDKLKGK